MRLNQVDLNLFVVFEAVYEERNLTRAAEVLCLSQPAVSNALARLRKTFNDRLFVRTPQGMVPTPVAENIVVRAREALNLFSACIHEGDVFQPELAEKVFQFSMNDLSEALVLPQLLEHLQQHAPGISISSYSLTREDVAKELAAGSLDFAIDVPLINDPNLCSERLSTEPFVCAVRSDHPLVQDELTIEQYLSLRHLHISSRRKGVGLPDIFLGKQGFKRDIQLRVQHYLAAPRIVRHTDLACTMPARLAKAFGLKGLPLPFEVPVLEWHLYWHKSADDDQANRWLRESLLALMP